MLAGTGLKPGSILYKQSFEDIDADKHKIKRLLRRWISCFKSQVCQLSTEVVWDLLLVSGRDQWPHQEKNPIRGDEIKERIPKFPKNAF